MNFASKVLMAIAALSFLLGHWDANAEILTDILTGGLGSQIGAGLPSASSSLANSNGLAGIQQLAKGFLGGNGAGAAAAAQQLSQGIAQRYGGLGAAGIGAGAIPAIGNAGAVGVPNLANGQLANGLGGQGIYGGRK
jgi:hypothetical protein